MKLRSLVLAITLLWLFAGPVAACEPPPAQSASGVGGGMRALTVEDNPATPEATDASACTVKPRSLEEVRRLVEQVQQTEATPAPTPFQLPVAQLPRGEPADLQTIAAITATTEQFIACMNAGDLLRFLAILSDDAVRSLGRELNFPLDDPSFATPQPTEEAPIHIASIEGVRMLPDGRVGAVVIPTAQMKPFFLYFVHEGDRWLIDGFVDIIREPTGNQIPCCDLPTPAMPTRWQLVHGATYDGVIVPHTAAPDFFNAVDGAEQPGYWTPSPAQIIQLEDDLWYYLMPPPWSENQVSPVPAEIWQNLSTYHRQYAGFVTEDGHRQIMVNFFCGAYTGSWQTQPVAVLDGGACFFRITYDLTTGNFSDLRINGEA
jgi:hypothetical protein